MGFVRSQASVAIVCIGRNSRSADARRRGHLSRALRLSPVEFVREMRVAAALKWHEAGLISQSKAAAVAGVSREALLMAAGKFRVSAVQVTPGELAEELSRDR